MEGLDAFSNSRSGLLLLSAPPWPSSYLLSVWQYGTTHRLFRPTTIAPATCLVPLLLLRYDTRPQPTQNKPRKVFEDRGEKKTRFKTSLFHFGIYTRTYMYVRAATYRVPIFSLILWAMTTLHCRHSIVPPWSLSGQTLRQTERRTDTHTVGVIVRHYLNAQTGKQTDRQLVKFFQAHGEREFERRRMGDRLSFKLLTLSAPKSKPRHTSSSAWDTVLDQRWNPRVIEINWSWIA